MAKLIDMTGQRFGNLTVIHKTQNRKSPSGTFITRWHCACDCGNELDVDAYALRSGNTKSCGCQKYGHAFKDISGKRFGMLFVQKLDHIADRKTYWMCQCDCGNKTVVAKSNLLNGNTKSCGCLHSAGEHEIKTLLAEWNVPFEAGYRFDDLRGPGGGTLIFDIAIMDLDGKTLCLIEYQGIQHYRNLDFGKEQREITDALKRQYCQQHNIPLHEIPYDKDIQTALSDIVSVYMPIPCQAQHSEKV